MITTKNLKVGQIVKNYKELCALMDLEPAQGNSKTTQLKEIDRYIDYKKSGHRFIITEIFDEPMPKEERLAANAKYVQYIEPLLLSFLARQKDSVAYVTRVELWEALGMVNRNYRLTKNNRDALVGLDEYMSLFDIKNFFMRSASRINGILNPTLERLKKKTLILYSEVYMVGLENDLGSGFIATEFHEATEEESRYILGVKHRVMESMKCEDEIEILLKGLNDVFYKQVGDILFEERGWAGAYKCLKIIFNKEHIESAASKELKKQLNNLVLEALDHQAEKNYEGNSTRPYKGPSKDFMYPARYVDMQKKLSNHLIKI